MEPAAARRYRRSAHPAVALAGASRRVARRSPLRLVQDLVERLAVVEALLLRCGETMDRDRIAGSAEPALEAPWLALHPIHLRVEAKVVARLHDLLAAEPAAEAPGPARVRPQRVALDQQRVLGLDLLGGTVVSVAVVHGDGRVAAVGV